MSSYSEYLQRFFPGAKVQKISVDAGFSCPNRDGRIATGGCSYCRNDSFTPGYCKPTLSVAQQIEAGKAFFARKYPEMKYLAYFQSYTNTYLGNEEETGDQTSLLRKLYTEALDCKDIVGLVIGTRPDTLPPPVIRLLDEMNRRVPVFVEIGAETSHNKTLRIINRHHTWQDVEKAVNETHLSGLHVGLHLIAGLPGERRDDILETIRKTIALPIETIKLHQLQVLLGTTLYKQWMKGETDVKPFELEEYLNLCAEIMRLVPDHIVIERFLAQSPPELVAAPKWGLKNYQFMNLLQNRVKSTR